MHEFKIPPRFFYDMDSLIERAINGERNKAETLLNYFCSAVERGEQVDPRVLSYIAAAWRRYLGDPKHDIAKALGLKRPKAGNPGGVSKKRRLSPEARKELGLYVYELMRDDETYATAIAAAAEQFEVSERTVSACYAAYLAERPIDEMKRIV